MKKCIVVIILFWVVSFFIVQSVAAEAITVEKKIEIGRDCLKKGELRLAHRHMKDLVWMMNDSPVPPSLEEERAFKKFKEEYASAIEKFITEAEKYLKKAEEDSNKAYAGTAEGELLLAVEYSIPSVYTPDKKKLDILWPRVWRACADYNKQKAERVKNTDPKLSAVYSRQAVEYEEKLKRTINK